MLYLHVIIAGSMRGNDHQRSEYWLFLGKERREGEGWGEPQSHDLGLKKMGSKHVRLKIWLTQWLVPDVQCAVLSILYDGNILQCKLKKININKIMSCRSVFTALCATGLQCPAGKTLPLLPSLPSASQDTACFSLQESVTLRMRLECHFSALQLLKVPLYPSVPLGDTNYPMVLSLNLAQMTPEHWLSQRSSLTWSVNLSSSASLRKPAWKANGVFRWHLTWETLQPTGWPPSDGHSTHNIYDSTWKPEALEEETRQA